MYNRIVLIPMKRTGIPRGLDENCHGTRPVKEQRTYETYQNCHGTGPVQGHRTNCLDLPELSRDRTGKRAPNLRDLSELSQDRTIARRATNRTNWNNKYCHGTGPILEHRTNYPNPNNVPKVQAQNCINLNKNALLSMILS